jgi:Zn-finger protein
VYFGFYTVRYEDYKPIHFKAVDCNICYAVINFNRIGMDDANYVYDEILVKLWD